MGLFQLVFIILAIAVLLGLYWKYGPGPTNVKTAIIWGCAMLTLAWVVYLIVPAIHDIPLRTR